jgi:hypothetical protein
VADVERGQLVIVTALTIAVGMVVLVLLLNGAIYTQNLAMRGGAGGSHDAVAYRGAVVDGVGGVITHENRAEHGDYGDVEENVTDGIERFDTLGRRTALDGDAFAEIAPSTLSTHRGELIRDDDASRQFTDSGGNPDWQLATDIEDTRAFRVNVTRTDLAATTENDLDVDPTFNVEIVDIAVAERWEVHVYENDSTSEIAVAVKRPGDALTAADEVCTVPGETAVVDVTGGALAGTNCSGFRFAEGITPPYDVEFHNGGQAAGTYNLTVNTTPAAATVNGVTLNDGTTNSAAPYHVPAVYDAAFGYVYETDAVTYADDLRVAPGESP